MVYRTQFAKDYQGQAGSCRLHEPGFISVRVSIWRAGGVSLLLPDGGLEHQEAGGSHPRSPKPTQGIL